MYAAAACQYNTVPFTPRCAVICNTKHCSLVLRTLGRMHRVQRNSGVHFRRDRSKFVLVIIITIVRHFRPIAGRESTPAACHQRVISASSSDCRPMCLLDREVAANVVHFEDCRLTTILYHGYVGKSDSTCSCDLRPVEHASHEQQTCCDAA